MVHYRCKSCGREHPVPVSFGEKLYFDSAVTLDLLFECPSTGQRRNYNKTDFLWREVDTPRPVGR